MRNEYVRNGSPENSTHTIPLFVPSTPIDLAKSLKATAASWIDLDSGAHKIVFLGRMTALKGPSLAIEAVSLLEKQLPRAVKLVCAGDGPEMDHCRKLASQLSLDVQFEGWLSSDAKESVFRNAALLILPSVWPEPFGLVGLEAAKHGVPSVSFDVGGIGEWLHQGVNGYQVQRGDLSSRSMANAMHRALVSGSTWERLSDGARKMAQRLTREAHLQRFETLCAEQGIG